MTTSIKVTALRTALNAALGNIDASIARGSLKFDKDTGEVTLTVDSGKGVKSTKQPAVSNTGDEAKDKFLNVVAKLGLDKKVRRWYNRNITDVNGGKWVISAISNKGDKFTLAPKDGEGRNKRVDFADVEKVIDEGRTGRIDLGTKPKGNKQPTQPSAKADSKETVAKMLEALEAKQVTEVYEQCLEKGLIEPAKRRNNKSRVAAILASDKLSGRGSVTTILKKFGSSPKPKASGNKSSLDAKQKRKLEMTLQANYNADRKRFAKEVSSKFGRVKFLTEYKVKDQVRVIVGYLVEEEKVRVFDPATNKFRKVDAAVVIRNLNK